MQVLTVMSNFNRIIFEIFQKRRNKNSEKEFQMRSFLSILLTGTIVG